MTPSRWAFAATLVLAAASIVFIILFGSPPDAGSAPRPEGFRSPVMALELARPPADLAFLQGPDAEALRAHMMRVQTLDWGFPLAYAGMAAAFFLGLALRPGPLTGLAWIGAAVALAAIPADYLENRAINLILADLAAGRDPGEWLGMLQLHTWIKWVAIGLYSALTAVMLWARGHRILALPGVLAAISVPAAWLGMPDGTAAEVMAVVLIPAFLVYPVAAALQLRRPEA